MDVVLSPQRYRHELLARQLQQLFGEIDAPTMALLREHLQWVEVAGGETLMAQGDPGDSMYLCISGRLRAYRRDDEGAPRMVREMARGEIVGEMSMYTDEPRTATVIAIRDSVLVRLAKPEFIRLLASNPQVSIALTRQLIRRLQTEGDRSTLATPVTIGLMPISDGIDAPDFGRRLAAQLARIGRVRVVDSAAIERELRPGVVADGAGMDHDAGHRIALLLDEIEAACDFVLLIGDEGPTDWTRRCSRHCDELLLLADAAQPPALHPIERQCLMRRPQHTEAAEILVLLHPSDARCPRGSAEWLARRPVAGHLHIRPALERDMARLARIQSRTAVGLVLAGGGARGLAHLGIYRALREHGIEIDCVGGTSIGAVMAALVAVDQPVEQTVAVARKAFSVNPTGDFNLLPLLSLITGRRLRGTIERALQELIGFDAHIEDLWKGYFCIAANYSQAREQQLCTGSLAQALLASCAIPGALPPVVRDGDLLCDGGTFNNFPVDVLRGMRGVGTVIGADLNLMKPRRMDFDQMPGSWALLRDRLRPRHKRRYRVPSLMSYLLNVTILYSTSRQRKAQSLTDLYFNPPLERVGLLAWDRFDHIVQQGYAHAVEVLARRDQVAPGPPPEAQQSEAAASASGPAEPQLAHAP